MMFKSKLSIDNCSSKLNMGNELRIWILIVFVVYDLVFYGIDLG